MDGEQTGPSLAFFLILEWMSKIEEFKLTRLIASYYADLHSFLIKLKCKKKLETVHWMVSSPLTHLQKWTQPDDVCNGIGKETV